MTKKILLMLLMAMVAFAAFAAEAVDEPEEEVVFRFNNASEPESLDPVVVSGYPEHRIYMALFEGLVVENPETLAADPGVAESWSVSADGLTYTFNLRDEAVWSDGVDITAQTVVDSWLRLLDPATAADYATLMTDEALVAGAKAYNTGEAGPEVVQISAPNDDTFVVQLEEPRPFFVEMLTHYVFGIHPLHAIEEYGDEWTRPENIVVNGPFTVETWIPQDRMEFVRNPSYWDADAVGLDRIIMYPIDDSNTALNMYLDGQLDWLPEAPPARLDEMKLDPGYIANPAFVTYYYEFNNLRPPLDDSRVRMAMMMSIDRQELVDRVTRGGQFPAFGLTPPLPGVYDAVVGFEEDTDAARELLAEAGFPGGEGFPVFTILYNTSETHKAVAEYVQQKWNEELGISVEIENQEWGTYLDTRDNKDFDIARGGWGGDYVDPLTFLGLLTEDSIFNSGSWRNPEFTRLMNLAASQQGEERLDTLQAAEQLAIEDAATMPFYYYNTDNWIDLDAWGGWYPTTRDFHPWKSMYRK